VRNKEFKIAIGQALVLPGNIADLEIKIADNTFIGFELRRSGREHHVIA